MLGSARLGGPGYPTSSGCQAEDHAHGLLALPRRAARNMSRLTGGPGGSSGRAMDDPTLREWLSSNPDEASMDRPAVQAVFDVLYAFRDEVLRVTGVHMPSRVQPQYPHG